VFPVGAGDQTVAEARIREHAERFYEETWVHRPLRSLNRIAPVDAAGHRVLRRKLLGVIQFLQDCAAGGALKGYDFDRLRRKLGLVGGAVPTSGGAAQDIGAMGAGELAALPVETLAEAQLEQARQSAAKLDAQELAEQFARALIARPRTSGGEPFDRGPSYFYLVQRALTAGNTDEALTLVHEGERDDSEHNAGRRQLDFELRRAQVHVKRRETDQAYDTYERLLQREPANQKARASAVEAMLSLRQGARAVKLAEEGLARARQENDRSGEEHFLELLAAAKKQGGA
jgi:tetratricopeptide (TPR) repeat protein